MFSNAALIVAHPDDETLWAAGTVLLHQEAKWTVITMCRKNDPDRASKFFSAMRWLNATGIMGDLDDRPEQSPLFDKTVQDNVLLLLPAQKFDLIITHSPYGEYTRHIRHEETSRAVTALWEGGKLITKVLWMFAYEDGNRTYLPRAIRTAHRFDILPERIWEKKYRIITHVYGFSPDSFEARATPRKEAFWCFETHREFKQWYKEGVNKK